MLKVEGLEPGQFRPVSIPIWSKTNKDQETMELQSYAEQMRRVTSTDDGLAMPESYVIYESIIRSGRHSLFEELPPEVQNSVELYLKYLESNYGTPLIARRGVVDRISQQKDESTTGLLNRVRKVLLWCYDSDEDLTLEQIEALKNFLKRELIYYFLKALKSAEVRLELSKKLDDLDVTKLGKQSKMIERAIDGAENVQNKAILHVKRDSRCRNHDRRYERHDIDEEEYYSDDSIDYDAYNSDSFDNDDYYRDDERRDARDRYY